MQTAEDFLTWVWFTWHWARTHVGAVLGRLRQRRTVTAACDYCRIEQAARLAECFPLA